MLFQNKIAIINYCNFIFKMLQIIKSRAFVLRTAWPVVYKCFHEDVSNSNSIDKQKAKPVQSKIIFKDSDSVTILDVEEERLQNSLDIKDTRSSIYENLNLERGTSGVFEIEELVEILRRDNAEKVFVCSVPKELKYVDYMCIVSGRSHRHMLAMAEFVRRVYKLKRDSGDILPKIEGEKSKDWMALDLGNIALHIFSPSARKLYDLESLWSLGSEFDAEFNKPEEPLVALYERHSRYLQDLKPKYSSDLA